MPEDRFEEMLTETDWSRVTHAYGPAEDVPDLLRALATGGPKERNSALQTLYGNIVHQGTRYPATVRAVACLIELLKREQQADKHKLLVLLTSLAVGYHFSFLDTGFDYSDRDIKRAWGRNAQGRSYVAVRAGADVYIHLLNHNDAKVRCAAAFLIAFIREAASTAIPQLETRLAQEASAIAKGSMLIATGMLSSVSGVEVDLVLLGQPIGSAAKSRSKRLVRACAALGLAYVVSQADAADVKQALAEAATDKELAKTDLPWNGGDLAGMAGLLIGRVSKLSGEDVLSSLLLAMEHAQNGHAGLQAAGALLDHLFEARKSPRLLPADLSSEQTEVLRAIHASDEAWRFGNMNWTMQEYALPESREMLGVFLGLDDAGVASKTLRIERAGKVETRPAWEWDQMMVDGLLDVQLFAEAIVEQRSMSDAITLCAGPIEALRSGGLQRVQLSVAVYDRLGARAKEALTRQAKAVLASDRWLGEASLSLAVALTRIALVANSKVPPIVDELISSALPTSSTAEERLEHSLAEEVLRAIPDDRRLKVLSFRKIPNWKLFRLAPPRGIFEHALRYLFGPNEENIEFVRLVAGEDLQVVISGLSEGTPMQRELLALGLADVQSEQSVSALFSMLDDSTARVRRAAVASLSQMPQAMLADGIAESLNSRRKARREAAQQLLQGQ